MAVPRAGEGLHGPDKGGSNPSDAAGKRGQRLQLRGRPRAELQGQELRRSNEREEGASASRADAMGDGWGHFAPVMISICAHIREYLTNCFDLCSHTIT